MKNMWNVEEEIKPEINFEIKNPVNVEKKFTALQLANIFNCSDGAIHVYSNEIGLQPKILREGARRFSQWSYSDYIILKYYIGERRKGITKDKIKIPVEMLNSSENEHPLVTDKRCLKLNYWPDVVPSCFQDLEEEGAE